MKLLSVLPVAFMRIMPLIAPAIAVPLLARPTGDEEGAFPPLTDPATPAPGNVFICAGPDWTPPCATYALGINGTCWSIPAPFAYNAGSAVPDPGAICRLFDDNSPTCTGSGVAILSYPGDPNLHSADWDPGSRARYWYCVECTNCR